MPRPPLAREKVLDAFESIVIADGERAATLEPEGWGGPSSYMCLVMPLRLMD